MTTPAHEAEAVSLARRARASSQSARARLAHTRRSTAFPESIAVCAEAERTYGRSRALVHLSRRLARSEPVVQCAWCLRASDGDGIWVPLSHLVLRPEQVTGSICPDCFAQAGTGDAGPA